MKRVKPGHPKLLEKQVGSEDWWESISLQESPLCMSLNNDTSLVCFVYRDNQNSNVGSVYMDLYSKTPHPTKQLTQFSKLEGTDVWYWETQLPNDWLGSYFIMPVPSGNKPPEQSGRSEMRRWWIQSMSEYAQSDSLNLWPNYTNGNGLSLSIVSLAHSEALTGTSNTLFPYADKKPSGLLTESPWHSKILNNQRSIWLYRTAAEVTEELPVVFLFDGQFWAQHLSIFTDLDALTSQGQLPPAQYVFIDSINTKTRSHELACNTVFWQALQQELIPWISTQFNITSDAKKTIVAGQSLGGLAAVFGAFHWPDRFASAISLSGSFWWPDVDSLPGEGELIQQIEQAETSTSLNLVLEAGCYENDMLEVSKAMAKTLKKKGHNIHFQEFRGGHDWLCWRYSLLRSLIKILQ
ncbi:MAG: enterochelin esterase [Marinomonas sp.]